jgi:tetratricopeptide (TPR) repeat protein
MDVFISYSRHDTEWVRGELLPRIEQSGLTAFIDFRDFACGAPNIKEMARGVKECPKTLLVLTPDYFASEWCDLELLMGQSLSPVNRDHRLIPLLRRPCDRPLYLGALTSIDFTDGADQDLAWRQLFTALGKPPAPTPPEPPRHVEWFLPHPYPMPPNFTGRVVERAMLDRWLDADTAHPLLIIRALGGFGKSALVWHWLTHDVRPAAWPRVVWWSFYEGEAPFERFMAETLGYLSETGPLAKLSGKDDVAMLWKMLRAPGTLLVLDGFERVLRAFGGLGAAYQGDDAISEGRDRDCISPLAELFLYQVALQPQLRSKVLLTTRLRPRVLEAKGGGLWAGCREEPLEEMQPADAVVFFRAHGIRGTHTEIERACAPYGYHPLSLCLLAGVIARDFQQAGDIAAASRLEVSGDLVQRQHHVLEAAYNRLTPSLQALLGRIACFRGPVTYAVLKVIAREESRAEAERGRQEEPFGSSPAVRVATRDLDSALRDLVVRGLVHHDTRESRFDLHPIIRRYAYARMTKRDRAAAHAQLRDYFSAVPAPDTVTRLEDLALAIELFHHTIRGGQFDDAWTVFRDRIWKHLYYELGGCQLQIDLLRELFPDGEDHPPRLKTKRAMSNATNELANSYSVAGQPHLAVSLFNVSATLDESDLDESNLAVDLSNMACMAQVPMGALRTAEANLRRCIELSRATNDLFQEAIGHGELGRLLAYSGAYTEASAALGTAIHMLEKQHQVEYQSVFSAYGTLCELLRLRHSAFDRSLGFEIPHSKSALASARRALELAGHNERNHVRAHWLLGAAHSAAGQMQNAESELNEALLRCRRMNMVDYEADILIDQARLRAARRSTGSEPARAADEAQRLAEEALLIADRSGYVLQGADARLELARLALSRGDHASAHQHAKEAHLLATCDGAPHYTYAAAYAESATLLARLSSLRDTDTSAT